MIPAILPTYGVRDIAFERGEGAWLVAQDGQRYLDFCGGLAVTILGHAHPYLVRILQDQAGQLWHTSNLYRIPHQERLAERLTQSSFADTVFFCNSGAEAVEASIKLTRKYFDSVGQPERYRIITTGDSFHGRTMTTISAAKNEKHMAGFEPAVDGFDQVAFGNLNEMRAAIGPQTAAILIEPVQGEGGVRAASEDYLKALREIADEFGLLLIFDEVQCGYGRTAKFFAHEWAQTAPDIMAVAKGIANGFPMGACLATERVGQAMTAGSHGSTFGGNPLACAVANGVLDILLEPGFFDSVETKARYLWGELEVLVRKHPGVFGGLAGRGMMLGLPCRGPNTEMLLACRRQGLLAATAGGNQLRLLPPVNVEQDEIDEAVAMIDAAASQLAPHGQA